MCRGNIAQDGAKRDITDDLDEIAQFTAEFRADTLTATAVDQRGQARIGFKSGAQNKTPPKIDGVCQMRWPAGGPLSGNRADRA